MNFDHDMRHQPNDCAQSERGMIDFSPRRFLSPLRHELRQYSLARTRMLHELR